MEVSEDDFNKGISIVASLLHWFDFSICLPTCHGTGGVYHCWASLRLLLAEDGHRQWEDDPIVLAMSPPLDPRVMVPAVRLFPVKTCSISLFYASPPPAA